MSEKDMRNLERTLPRYHETEYTSAEVSEHILKARDALVAAHPQLDGSDILQRLSLGDESLWAAARNIMDRGSDTA